MLFAGTGVLRTGLESVLFYAEVHQKECLDGSPSSTLMDLMRLIVWNAKINIPNRYINGVKP